MNIVEVNMIIRFFLGLICCLLTSDLLSSNRLFQATSTVEVDMERAEKLQVTRTDFMASLNNDIKPVSI